MLDQVAQRTESNDLKPMLTVVIVNFNGWSDVVRLVDSLSRAPEVAAGVCEIVVVDNASEGPVPRELASPPRGVRLIERSENGGFAVGVNAGWQEARSRWLLLVNPDVVAGSEVIGQVLGRVEALDAEGPEAPGVVGFGLRNPDGGRQPSVGAEPSVIRAFWEPFLPRSRRKYKAGWANRGGLVPWVTGAFALVDGQVLEALGGMDEEFFLYYEEVALCRSSRGLGRPVRFDPSIEVVHERPLQSRPISARMRVITRHSKLLYFQKHRPGWEFQAMSRLTGLEALVRGGVARLRGRRAEARAWSAVGRLSEALRRGARIVGREVLVLADSALRAPVHRAEPGVDRPYRPVLARRDRGASKKPT